MPKKQSTKSQPPYYIKQLKDGRWAVFDQQQRIHGGTHAAKAAADIVLAAKLGAHQKPSSETPIPNRVTVPDADKPPQPACCDDTDETPEAASPISPHA